MLGRQLVSMGQDWLLAMSIQDVPCRPGRVPAEAHTKRHLPRVVDEYLHVGIAAPRREQEAIGIRADRSVLLCRPRFCLVDRLKAAAYGVEVVALQPTQVIAHTKPGYGITYTTCNTPEVITLVQVASCMNMERKLLSTLQMPACWPLLFIASTQ